MNEVNVASFGAVLSADNEKLVDLFSAANEEVASASEDRSCRFCSEYYRFGMAEDAEGKLVKAVTLVGKAARRTVRPLLLLLVGSTVTTLSCVSYVRWVMEENWWWSSAPLLLMFVPLLALLYYWLSLDGICKLPEALVSSKQTWTILCQRYAARKNKREMKGSGLIASFLHMQRLLGFLWDSRDVLDTATNLVGLLDLFNPIFWLIQAISLVCSVVFCSLFIVVCALHFFFFL